MSDFFTTILKSIVVITVFVGIGLITLLIEKTKGSEDEKLKSFCKKFYITNPVAIDYFEIGCYNYMTIGKACLLGIRNCINEGTFNLDKCIEITIKELKRKRIEINDDVIVLSKYMILSYMEGVRKEEKIDFIVTTT